MIKDAYASDRKNGEIIADLADVAEHLEQWNVAIKTLRNVILYDGECRISHAEASLRQGRICHIQGDDRKARQWAQRALQEGAEQADVDSLLSQIGEA